MSAPENPQQIADTPGAGLISEEEGLRELGLLYNYAEDDSRQFTRWQMLVAMSHGYRLASEKAPLLSDRTLRDWFAGQALAGRMADGFTGVDDASVNARVAYKMADAMLAQREGV